MLVPWALLLCGAGGAQASVWWASPGGLGLSVPLGRLCRAEGVGRCVRWLADGWPRLGVRYVSGGHAHPRRPGGSPTPGRGRPTPRRRGLRQTPPQMSALWHQLPAPAWATLPAPVPPACTAGPPPPSQLGWTPGGALSQCALGCCPGLCSRVPLCGWALRCLTRLCLVCFGGLALLFSALLSPPMRPLSCSCRLLSPQTL